MKEFLKFGKRITIPIIYNKTIAIGRLNSDYSNILEISILGAGNYHWDTTDGTHLYVSWITDHDTLLQRVTPQADGTYAIHPLPVPYPYSAKPQHIAPVVIHHAGILYLVYYACPEDIWQLRLARYDLTEEPPSLLTDRLVHDGLSLPDKKARKHPGEAIPFVGEYMDAKIFEGDLYDGWLHLAYVTVVDGRSVVVYNRVALDE